MSTIAWRLLWTTPYSTKAFPLNLIIIFLSCYLWLDDYFILFSFLSSDLLTEYLIDETHIFAAKIGLEVQA